MGACTRIIDLCKTYTFILKLLELTLGLVCVGLVSGNSWLHTTISKEQTMYATLFGFFMLEVVIVLGYVLDYPIQRIVVLVICSTAAVMHLVAGGLLIEVWHKSKPFVHDKILGAGILSLFNGLAFGVDVTLTLINCRGDGTSTFGQP